MASTPVTVQPTTPPATRAPDLFRSLRSEMDRLFDSFTGSFGFVPFPSFNADRAPGSRAPAMDITEDEGAFKLSAELPGLGEADVRIWVSEDLLTIRGEKRREREAKERNFHLSERSYGEFQRSFHLPASVDAEQIAAAFNNGVLTITLPKTSQAAPKQIPIKPAV